MIKLSCNKLLRNVVELNFNGVTRTKKGNYKTSVMKKVNPIVFNMVEIELSKILQTIFKGYFNTSNFEITIVHNDSYQNYYVHIELNTTNINSYSNKQVGEYFIVNVNDLQLLTSELYKTIENSLAYSNENKLHLEY